MIDTSISNIGFIFDWDGVVIDSHAQHEESWQVLFEELGRPLPEGFFKRTFGMRNQQIIPLSFDFVRADDATGIARLGDRKEELYREILGRDGIEPLPGVVSLLREIKSLGAPAVVGSSTPRKNIETVMAMAGLDDLFDAVVSADDVTVGKPDPQVFLKGAEKIGRIPGRCIVFEDAHVGIEAGKRAGMKVVAVATTHPIESLAEADVALPDLSGVTVEQLLRMLGWLS
jgi:HAD superfamily hydrolase (TIGR01509 family)